MSLQTLDELRAHFDLKQCPNKPHSFAIGRLMGEWVWAEDRWSQLVGQTMQTIYFGIVQTKTLDNLTAYSCVIWRLKIIWIIV